MQLHTEWSDTAISLAADLPFPYQDILPLVQLGHGEAKTREAIEAGINQAAATSGDPLRCARVILERSERVVGE